MEFAVSDFICFITFDIYNRNCFFFQEVRECNFKLCCQYILGMFNGVLFCQ